MYYRPRRYGRQERSRAVNFIVPFLILISIGIIVVLGFNLWKSIFAKEKVKAAYMHIIKGNVQMNTWGTDKYFDLTSDALLIEGDSFKTSADGKIIVEFFDGTIMRVSGNSDLTLDSINDSIENPKIGLKLTKGKLWFNKIYKDTRNTEIQIVSQNVNVESKSASSFELENDTEEVVRVFNVFNDEGLFLQIFDKAKEKFIADETVGVGQEASFNKKVLGRYWQHESPSVLSAISDNFKTTDWYLWNIEEDTSPTKFQKVVADLNQGLKKVEPEIINQPEDRIEDESAKEIDQTLVNDDPTAVDVAKKDEVVPVPLEKSSNLKLSIASVAGKSQINVNGFYESASRVTTLTGNVEGADKVVVNGYTLTKFMPGDSTWSYFANADFGLMKEGENTYEIYALDKDGKKSETLVVKVLYAPPKVVESKVETSAKVDSSAGSAAPID